ncbi:integrase/recombinase%2C phage integrase family [Streptococcus pneumoniae]|nr:integrase/recombinase%2C phage integrase family [Streptococcus pneumoniae]
MQTSDQLVFTYIDTKGNVNSPLHVDYLNNKMNSVKRRHPKLKHATPHISAVFSILKEVIQGN